MTAAEGPTELASPARARSGRFDRGAWLSVGNGTYAACQWLVLVVLAKVTDSTTVGQYALALAVTAPIFMFSGLALRTVALTHDRTGLHLGHFVAVRLAASSLSVVAVVLVSLLFDRDAALILFLVAMAKCLDSIGDICLTPFQQHRRFGVMATSVGLNGLLTFAGMSAVLLVTPTLPTALVASVAASAIASVALPLIWLRTMRHQLGGPIVTPSPLTAQAWKSPTLVGVSTLALPLGLASGIASLTNNVPRYALQVGSSSAALGIFAIITYVVNVSGIVSGSVAQALLPSMTSLARAGDLGGMRYVLRRTMTRTALLMAPALIASLFLTRPVLDALLGPTYAKYWAAFTLALFALLLSSISYLADTALSACGMYRHQLATTVVVLVITVIGAAVLIPAFGITGAAWALCLEMATRAAIKLGILARALRRVDKAPFTARPG